MIGVQFVANGMSDFAGKVDRGLLAAWRRLGARIDFVPDNVNLPRRVDADLDGSRLDSKKVDRNIELRKAELFVGSAGEDQHD